ncbi:lipid IV(A) palmitoyltransferase PagP [Pandoraea sputorum]|uniref:Lipid A palmitoyltransferase PagP n=2 Tax=Pandoraea sputorum TaxID=93222 RepID=A0A239SMN7_9BURK|nr:lipid IV(A) palmitoyltransferase PagP [Pandoraea sputorum]SNU86559.1 Lipid A palmitoyltransferase PagP precursor [Pandoraea sputorum]VVE31167.1 Lipid A palmitoyltransferase PagP [Pandoraea sputorum]
MTTTPQVTGRLAPSISLAPLAPLPRTFHHRTLGLSSRLHSLPGSLASQPSRSLQATRFARVFSMSSLCVASAVASLMPLTAHADDSPGVISTWTGAIADEFREIATEGASELYVPLHTHHLRFAYTREKIAQYNENPWGLGYGRVLSDGKNGSRMLYAMAFKDSHNDWSPMAGYGRIWNVANAGPVRFGLGYTVFLMSRSDTLGGVPFPAALPLAEVGIGRAAVATAYVPGGKGNGNVLFIFGRYTFGKPG